MTTQTPPCPHCHSLDVFIEDIARRETGELIYLHCDACSVSFQQWIEFKVTA